MLEPSHKSDIRQGSGPNRKSPPTHGSNSSTCDLMPGFAPLFPLCQRHATRGDKGVGS